MATPRQKQLMQAIQQGKLAKVRQLLAAGCSPNARGLRPDTTPLHEAVRSNDLTIVRTLVQAGAQVNAKDRYTDTPLDVAIYDDCTKIEAYLRTQGALRGDDDDLHNTTGKNTVASRSKPRKMLPPGHKNDKGFTPRGPGLKNFNSKVPPQNKNFTSPMPEPTPPRYTPETLRETFEAEKWVGKIDEMKKLWNDVPKKLKKDFDFAAQLSEARRQTMHTQFPTEKLHLKPKRPPAEKPPSAG